MLGSAIKKYLEVNNLNKIKLTNKLAIEIIDDAHNKWEIVTSLPQHKLRDSIKKKCGAVFETMYEKSLREEKERRITLKDKAHEMRDDIVKKHDEEMQKEMEYWGVDEKSLEDALNPKVEEVVDVSTRVEIMKGTMDDTPEEEPKPIVQDEIPADFIGNISQPELEPIVEEIKEVIEETVEEVVEVIKEEVKEVVKEAKKVVEKVKEEIDIDEILKGL